MSDWLARDQNGLVIANKTLKQDVQYCCEKVINKHTLLVHWWSRKDGTEDSFRIVSCDGKSLEEPVEIHKNLNKNIETAYFATTKGILVLQKKDGVICFQQTISTRDYFGQTWLRKHRSQII